MLICNVIMLIEVVLFQANQVNFFFNDHQIATFFLSLF